MPGRILIVDDERSMCEMLDADLRSRGFDPSWFTTAQDATEMLKREDFDAVLTDLNMPGMTGIELCQRIVGNGPDVPVIVMTAFGSMESAISAIRAGAYDFVTKPVEMDMLALTVERAVQHRVLKNQVKVLSAAVERTKTFDEILGESPPMLTLFDELARLADSETSVLVMGESGTGKELVVRALHKQSSRKDKPFVAVDCAALPETLLESELFGHKRGAFTDARSDKKGLFLQADGGTLFLDEIGNIPLTLQPKLLRALEERRIRPVGGDKEIRFDVRLIAATNRDLESAVEENRFREDLYYRINVVQITTPPLRARGTDTLLLAQAFLERFAARAGKNVVGISEPVAAKLLTYSWPGNVRELRNAIERTIALTRFDKIAVEDLPEKIQKYNASHMIIGSDNPSELVPLEEIERRYIKHVADAVGGNRTLAARILGLDRKTLYRKLKQFDADDS